MIEAQTESIPANHPDYKLFQDDIRSMCVSEPNWDSPAALWAWKAWHGGRVRERTKRNSLGELLPEGLTDEQKIKVLDQCRRFALFAFKRIAGGISDPVKYAELTIKHLDTPSSEYLVSNEISETDIEEAMDTIIFSEDRPKKMVSETIYTSVRLSDLCAFVSDILKKVKL